MAQPWLVWMMYSTLSTANLSESQAGSAAPSPSNSDTAIYMQGIQRATDLQRKAATRTTQQMRDEAMQEFSNWLALRVQHRNVQNCTPEDFAVYLTMHWMGTCRRRNGWQPGTSNSEREHHDLTPDYGAGQAGARGLLGTHNRER